MKFDDVHLRIQLFCVQHMLLVRKHHHKGAFGVIDSDIVCDDLAFCKSAAQTLCYSPFLLSHCKTVVRLVVYILKARDVLTLGALAW